MKKPILNYYITKSTIGNHTYTFKCAYIKESLMYSIISDLFTFSTLLISFAVNQYFIHSKLVSTILLLCFLLTLNSTQKHQIMTKEEFIEEVNKCFESKTNGNNIK